MVPNLPPQNHGAREISVDGSQSTDCCFSRLKDAPPAPVSTEKNSCRQEIGKGDCLSIGQWQQPTTCSKQQTSITQQPTPNTQHEIVNRQHRSKNQQTTLSQQRPSSSTKVLQNKSIPGCCVLRCGRPSGSAEFQSEISCRKRPAE